MKRFKFPSLYMAITAASLLVVSCDDESLLDDELPTVNVDSDIAPPNQDIVAIISAKQGVDDLTAGISSPAAQVESNFESMVSIMDSMNLFASEEEAPITVESRLLAKSTSDNSIDDTVASLFDASNATADLSTNTITIGVNSENFCEDEEGMLDTDCVDMMQDVTLQVQVINTNAGIITVQYNAHSPFSFSYAPNYLAVLVDFGELKAAGEAYDTEMNSGFFTDAPSDMTGQLALSINSTTDTASVKAWIPETISFGDGNNSIDVAQTDNLMTFSLDAVAQTMQFTSSLSAITGEVMAENSDVSIDFAGATFDLLIDGDAQEVTLTDSGILEGGLSISMDEEVFLTAAILPFSAQYSEVSNLITLGSAFEAMIFTQESEMVTDSVVVDDAATETQLLGELTVSLEIDADSELAADDDLELESGSAVITGSFVANEECIHTWDVTDEESTLSSDCTDNTDTIDLSKTIAPGELLEFDEQ